LFEALWDSFEQALVWKSNPDLGILADNPVRLPVELRDADPFSMRFVEKPP